MLDTAQTPFIASTQTASIKCSYSTLAIIAITLLAIILNFSNLQVLGDGNTYYTAAVKSMLQSPANFFFVAAEPGGSVTIDKPPLGLWLQAISAAFLGVNGFAVMLPQLLAGVFSIPVLYHLIKRSFGTSAGLLSAFVLAVTPVAIAVQRNNTMDATLIFTLLLAAWAFIKATETGQTRWLLLGGLLVGLGFNIKMLQAFLPLPAFYALYFLGAKVTWWHKIGQLLLTSAVLLAVSLSWMVVVDLTPADQRPYVGSSETNSALELALGYNGIQRLLGGLGNGTPRAITSTNSSTSNTPVFTPPNNGGAFGGEIGQAGILRLFSLPLANEIAWLLPFGLASIGLLLFSSRLTLPLSLTHQALGLWGGWLITEVIFFSAASFFHAYYLAMLAVPLAGLLGIGLSQLWTGYTQGKRWSAYLLIALVSITSIYQVYLVTQYTTNYLWALPFLGVLLAGAVLLLLVKYHNLFVLAGISLAIALLGIPTVWSVMTTFDTNPSSVLPHAYNGGQNVENGNILGAIASFISAQGSALPSGQMPNFANGQRPTLPNGQMPNSANGQFPPLPNGQMPNFAGAGVPSGFGGLNQDLLDYLQANTQESRYLFAVQSANEGASYVLETGRPVLYMGGFGGNDPVIDAQGLADLVEAGELRYVLSFSMRLPIGVGMGGVDTEISTYLSDNCQVVNDISVGTQTLYQCGIS